MALTAVLSTVISSLIERTGVTAASKLLNIRPWRLERYITGSISPVTSTIRRARNVYRSVNYSFLRQAGFSTRASNQLKSRSFADTEKWISDLERSKKYLAKQHNIPESWVADGISRSKKAAEDMVNYGKDKPF